MAHGAPPDVGLGDLRHLDRGHRAGWDAGPLQCILQRQSVDDGGEHAHVVAGRAIESALSRGKATEDVASADHDRDLHAHLVHTLDLRRDRLDDLQVDAVVAAAAERLTAQFEQHPVVLG